MTEPLSCFARRLWLARVLLACALAVAPTAWASRGAANPAPAAPTTPAEPLSPNAQQLLGWVRAQHDAGSRPFAIVDKPAARLHVFDAQGRWVASTSVLLGLAPGDDAVPGLGARPLSAIRPHERTTPAGRFNSQPGHTLSGDPVVWFDYGAALSIHRLRPAPAAQRRPQRLLSATPADNRISLGCVIVRSAFFDAVVEPVLGRGPGVVYVLPETRPLQAVFNLGGAVRTAGGPPPR